MSGKVENFRRALEEMVETYGWDWTIGEISNRAGADGYDHTEKALGKAVEVANWESYQQT